MWEKFVEELLSMWAYLSLNKEERDKSSEDKEENNSQSDNPDD